MNNLVKINRIPILLVACLLPFSALASAQEDIVEKALQACQSEIESYCSQVTPGDGRLLACFIAHEDRLSGQCGWALYEAMDAVETFMDAIVYVADSCWDDMVEYCADVELGEGRVATCLLDHKSEVSQACSEAMDEVELEVVEEE